MSLEDSRFLSLLIALALAALLACFIVGCNSYRKDGLFPLSERGHKDATAEQIRQAILDNRW